MRSHPLVSRSEVLAVSKVVGVPYMAICWQAWLSTEHARTRSQADKLLAMPLERIIQAAVDGQAGLIVLSPSDDQASSFYRKFGFRPVKDNPRRAVHKIATVRKNLQGSRSPLDALQGPLRTTTWGNLADSRHPWTIFHRRPELFDPWRIPAFTWRCGRSYLHCRSPMLQPRCTFQHWAGSDAIRPDRAPTKAS